MGNWTSFGFLDDVSPLIQETSSVLIYSNWTEKAVKIKDFKKEDFIDDWLKSWIKYLITREYKGKEVKVAKKSK